MEPAIVRAATKQADSFLKSIRKQQLTAPTPYFTVEALQIACQQYAQAQALHDDTGGAVFAQEQAPIQQQVHGLIHADVLVDILTSNAIPAQQAVNMVMGFCRLVNSDSPFINVNDFIIEYIRCQMFRAIQSAVVTFGIIDKLQMHDAYLSSVNNHDDDGTGGNGNGNDNGNGNGNGNGGNGNGNGNDNDNHNGNISQSNSNSNIFPFAGTFLTREELFKHLSAYLGQPTALKQVSICFQSQALRHNVTGESQDLISLRALVIWYFENAIALQIDRKEMMKESNAVQQHHRQHQQQTSNTPASRSASESSSSILTAEKPYHIVMRVCPFVQRKFDDVSYRHPPITMPNANTVVLPQASNIEAHYVDQCIWSWSPLWKADSRKRPGSIGYSSQADVWNEVNGNGIVEQLWEGENITMLGYGGLGSGKGGTGNMYNFIGAPVGNSETPLWEFCYEDLRGSVTQSGLVPRILRALSAKSRETKKRMVWQMSILELKESRLIDLLQNRREVKILGGQPREIVWEPFETESQMRALWEHGCRERTVRFTPDQYYPQNSNVSHQTAHLTAGGHAASHMVITIRMQHAGQKASKSRTRAKQTSVLSATDAQAQAQAEAHAKTRGLTLREILRQQNDIENEKEGAGTNYLRIVDLAFEAPDMSWGENDNISSTRKRTHKKTRSSSSLSATSGVSSKSLNTGAGVIDREHDGSNRENNQGFADWKKAGYEDEIAYCNTALAWLKICFKASTKACKEHSLDRNSENDQTAIYSYQQQQNMRRNAHEAGARRQSAISRISVRCDLLTRILEDVIKLRSKSLWFISMPSSPQFSWQCGSLLKFVEDIDYNAVNAHAKTQNRTKTKIASDPINDSLAGDAMNSRDFAHNKSTAMKAEATRGERERRRLSMRRQKRRSFIVEPRGQSSFTFPFHGWTLSRKEAETAERAKREYNQEPERYADIFEDRQRKGRL